MAVTARKEYLGPGAVRLRRLGLSWSQIALRLDCSAVHAYKLVKVRAPYLLNGQRAAITKLSFRSPDRLAATLQKHYPERASP